MADNLGGRVALDALRAPIPVYNAPIEVEHVDGVVNDRIDQKAETLLAFFKVSKRLMAVVGLRFIARFLVHYARNCPGIRSGVTRRNRSRFWGRSL